MTRVDCETVLVICLRVRIDLEISNLFAKSLERSAKSLTNRLSEPVGTQDLVDTEVLGRGIEEIVVVDHEVKTWHGIVCNFGDRCQRDVNTDLILESLAVLRQRVKHLRGTL